MRKTHIFRLLVAAASVASIFLAAVADSDGYSSWTPMNNLATCRGSIAECMGDAAGEFDMDTESNRRILATKTYISYRSLKPNNVPCDRRGASYYNCRPGAGSNPYKRTCSTATHCRS